MHHISKSQILRETQPLQASQRISGNLRRCVIEEHALPALEQEHCVVFTKLLGSSIVVHVYREASQEADFEPVTLNLEDVYFSTMSGHYGQNVVQAEMEVV